MWSGNFVEITGIKVYDIILRGTNKTFPDNEYETKDQGYPIPVNDNNNVL